MTPPAPACQRCGGDLELIADTPVGPLLECRACGRGVRPEAADVAERAVRGATCVRRGNPEAQLVHGIVEGLRLKGRLVLRCGQRRADLAGSDPGIGDLLVWAPEREAWLMIDAKTRTGRLSRAQRALADAGRLFIVRSIDEALSVVGERL